MNSLVSFLVVFCGAGIGGMLRHAVNCIGRGLGIAFPWLTLVVNGTGCMLMGLIAGWFTLFGTRAGGQTLQLFLMTGILGGYTTFSAFSLDAVLLWERRQFGLAVLYVISSILAALLGVFVGLGYSRGIFGPGTGPRA